MQNNRYGLDLIQETKYHKLQAMMIFLGVPEIDFDYNKVSDTVGGYCSADGIAISRRVISGELFDIRHIVFHECSHYLLGHSRNDSILGKYLRENKDYGYASHVQFAIQQIKNVNEIEAESITNSILKTLLFDEETIKLSNQYLRDYINDMSVYKVIKVNENRRVELLNVRNQILNAYRMTEEEYERKVRRA